jgi:hypothetical protein
MSSLRDKKSSRTEVIGPAVSAGPAEVVIGTIAGMDDHGAPMVDFVGNPYARPIRALATARYDQIAIGSCVALMFLEGDPARPLVIGLIAQEGPGKAEPIADPAEERLILAAARELVIRCGRASIVLTSAGKVLVRGNYISSRSSGALRITGASVQLN